MSLSVLLLDPEKHLHHGWKRSRNYSYTAAFSRVPLLLQELSAALPHYTLAFTPGANNTYQLVALLGIYAGENEFLESAGSWLAGYIPCHLRAYPFAMKEFIENERYRVALCFDQGSGLYRELPNEQNGEERFFTDQGEPRPMLQQLLTFGKAVAINRLQTQRAVDALAAAQLLEPWELPRDNTRPESSPQQGLYRISEAALNAQNGQSLEKLRNANALPVAYAQMFSQSRLGILRQLHYRRAPQPIAQTQALLDELFGDANDDLINFI